MQKETPKETHAYIMQRLDDKWLSYLTVKTWCAVLQCGDFGTQNAGLSERTSTISTSEIADHVHDLILADQQILAIRIGETLKDNQGIHCVYSHKHFDMQKLSVKCGR